MSFEFDNESHPYHPLSQVSEGQLSLASKIINSQAINRIVRQYTDDEISASAAVAAMNKELSQIN